MHPDPDPIRINAFWNGSVGVRGMTYEWDDWRLDPDGDLLTRQGRQVDASRKILGCIGHLLAQRHRVVGYDELSRAVWGHGNVTHNQLSQVILAARRTLGDDGQSQRLIRTLPGLGYRWVGPLRETPERIATPATGPAATPLPDIAPAAASADATRPPAAQPPVTPEAPPSDPGRRVRNRRFVMGAGWVFALGLAALAITLGLVRKPEEDRKPPIIPPSARKVANGPLSELWRALEQARFDDVAQGLVALPPALADSPDAKLLEIHLEIRRGRFDQAEKKLTVEQIRAAESADPIRQARLFSAQAFLNGISGRPGRDVLAPAQAAMQLLETAGVADQPSQALGEALSTRGYGYMKTLDLEPAVRDLVAGRKMLLAVGDPAGAADAADSLARIHMRTGRFHEALELMTEIASYSRRADNPINELYALGAATKIQIELLRWDDALATSERSLQILRTKPVTERRTRVLLLRALALTGVGRMREARSMIDEAHALHDKRYSPIAEATHRLAAGDARGALQAASDADAFDGYSINETLNLESREGALLLWLSAARALAKTGEPMPPLPPARLALLQAPGSSVGHLARGHWLWSQSRPEEAEAAFREASAQAHRAGHLARMLAATEALVELRLERGDRAAAEQAFETLWRSDPDVLAKDYRANLLALRVALATGDRAKAASAHRTLATTAGERRLPADLEARYLAWTATAGR
jgi:DNA-binding winged helix-turn-helix (wHTH) protein/tetratricopeptide (TPR) repeat protein